MFEDLIRLAKNAKALNRNKILKEVFDDPDMKDDIVSLNQGQLFEDGVDSKNVSLGEYSLFTKAIKEKKGQRTDHITLKDTGKFYDSMKVRSERKSVVIEADMKKPDTDLEVIYPNALGLTDESIQAIQGLALPIIRDKVLKQICR